MQERRAERRGSSHPACLQNTRVPHCSLSIVQWSLIIFDLISVPLCALDMTSEQLAQLVGLEKVIAIGFKVPLLVTNLLFI